MAEELEHTTLRIRRSPVTGETVQAGDEAQIIVLAGHATGRRYPLQDSFELGRGPDSSMQILDDGVSRRHARIQRLDDGSFSIEDLGSRNGTFVNGERIDRVSLGFGDKIAVGSRTVLLFANRDRYEDQRIQAQKLQALGQLAGGIAHDFNNLLGVVLANITHLQGLQRFDDEQVRTTLGEVEVAARRAVDLTRQLLTFARSGQRKHQATDVTTLVEDARRLLGRTLHRNIELQTETEDELCVMGESSQLLQVLMNLCINAGDAMPGGGRLSIRARRRILTEDEVLGPELSLSGSYVSIEVTDEGHGIEPDVLPRIFEPFFTTKPRGKGTGLGLATALAIARGHGGHVRATSKVGAGTTFEVLLPASLLIPGEDQPEAGIVRGPTPGVVLLADDEELIRLATSRVLEHAGLEVLTAVNGQHAVDLFLKHASRIDMAVLDLDMPGLDGEQAFMRLHQLEPDLPVLISSGYVDADRENALLDAGVTGILSKPYDSATLLRTIESVLRHDQVRA